MLISCSCAASFLHTASKSNAFAVARRFVRWMEGVICAWRRTHLVFYLLINTVSWTPVQQAVL